MAITQNADGTATVTLTLRDALDYGALAAALDTFREQVTEDAARAPAYMIEPILGALDHLTAQFK